MLGLDPLDEDAGGTVFRDVVMLALVGFVALVVMLLPRTWAGSTSSLPYSM